MPQKSKEETHLTIPGLQTITVGRLQNLKQPGTPHPQAGADRRECRHVPSFAQPLYYTVQGGLIRE